MPFVKEYNNDEELAKDVQKLRDNGVNKDNVYVLSHDDDRTNRVADNADASTIKQDFSDAVGNMFNKKGDELRSKLEEVGFSEAEATNYEKEMDKGKILLIVDEDENVENVLGF
ncbi:MULTISPECIES: general stress protein [Allobacillus]|uniref:General stress protein n=1 Tax=Allobacillus salarius TaxID=1955272 RepID=A0A556PPA2_9BACI|nr:MULTISPECIES: general stress protein [Allobacillus]TSJ66214.1 general stress protein [Allobacillus salarius]TSJ66909.1 general stress protein [Allobacillus sp. SKP2-8]